MIARMTSSRPLNMGLERTRPSPKRASGGSMRKRGLPHTSPRTGWPRRLSAVVRRLTMAQTCKSACLGVDGRGAG